MRRTHLVAKSNSPIGLPVRIASGSLGLFLVFLGAVPLAVDIPGENPAWWLPAALGIPFLLPVFASPVRPNESSQLASRRRKAVATNRILSFFSLLGAVGLDRFVPEGRRPLAEDPTYGPLLIVLSVVFMISFLRMFYLAYLVARSEMATSSAA